MKKLYKKSFHTVLYLEEEEALKKADNILEHLNKYCGLSESKLEEVKSVEDLPDDWNESDNPTTECFEDAKDIESYSYAISDFTIEEILQEHRFNSLEDENKKLKEQLRQYQDLLSKQNIYVKELGLPRLP